MASRIVRASRLSCKLVLFSLLYSKLSALERKKIVLTAALVTHRYNDISRELGAGIVFVLKRTRHSIPCVHLTLANVIQSDSGIQLRNSWLMALLRIHVGARGTYILIYWICCLMYRMSHSWWYHQLRDTLYKGAERFSSPKTAIWHEASYLSHFKSFKLHKN